MRRGLLAAGALALAVVCSAVGVVYIKHLSRAMFVELQGLAREREALEVEWGQLQLEASTWAANDRVARIAVERLNLYTPPAEDVVLVKP